VTLRGQFGPVTATLDGQPVPVVQTSEGIRVDVSISGQHELVITP
jgi:hypothetical protein